MYLVMRNDCVDEIEILCLIQYQQMVLRLNKHGIEQNVVRLVSLGHMVEKYVVLNVRMVIIGQDEYQNV